MLRVPQLADGTPSTTQEYTDRLAWPRDHYLLRLQERVDPPVADLGDEQLDLAAQTHRFVDALQRTAAWATFVDARELLTGPVADQLRTVNTQLRAAMKPDRVDTVAGDVVERRNRYRVNQLHAAIARLDGDARVYVDAFSVLEELLQVTLSDVLGNFVSWGEPRPVEAGDVNAEADGRVSFIYPGPLEVGELRLLAASGVCGAVLVEGAYITERDGVPVMRYRGRLLPGTDALSR